MRRANVVRVLSGKQQKQILEIIGDRCAALWNAVQYRCRQAFFEGESVPSYGRLCSEFKEHESYKALPAHIGQEVIKKARKAWDSFFALLRLYRKGELKKPPRIPRYWKDRRTGKRFFRIVPVKASTSYSLNTRYLSLTLPQDLRAKRGDRLVLPVRGILRFAGVPKTLELWYDPAKKRWYAHQVVKVPEPERKKKPEKQAALNLGARVLAALAVEGWHHQLLFSGREVWKDFVYWTKKIAAEQARLNKAGRKTSRRLKKLYQIRARRLKHAFVALAAELVRILKRHRVTVLFVEDLTGIRDDMDFGPKNILVHNFWAFGMLRRLVAAACARVGIGVVASAPRGTSSGCAVCGSSVLRPVRYKAVCETCGCVWHADANAALNILLQGSSKGHGVEVAPRKPLSLRWNYHRWESRFASAAGTPTGAASGVPKVA